MLPGTLAYLGQQNLLLGDRVDRDAIAERCETLFLGRPVNNDDYEEIDGKALIIAEIRNNVLGEPGSVDVERELDDIITIACAAEGKVQKRLAEHGLVLCAVSVERRLGDGNGNGAVTIRRRGRFVTANADAIDRYFWTPASSRLVSSASSYQRRLVLGVDRQPALAGRRPELVAKALEEVHKELPSATGNGS